MNYILVPSHRMLWGRIADLLLTEGLTLSRLICTPAQRECLRQAFPTAAWMDLERLSTGSLHERVSRAQLEKLEQRLDYRGVERQFLDMCGRFERYSFLPHYEKLAMFLLNVGTASAVLEAEKAQAVIFAEAPHIPFLFVLQEVARALHIPTIQLNANPIAPTVFASVDDKIIPPIRRQVPDEIRHLIHDWIDRTRGDYQIARPRYMEEQERADAERRRVFRRSHLEKLRNVIRGQLLTPEQMLIKRHREMRMLEFDVEQCETRKRLKSPQGRARSTYRTSQKNLRAFYQSLARSLAHLPRPYVFYPLQFQPERTTNPDGGRYYDQTQAALYLRRLLPADVELVLREHPSQFLMFKKGFGHRSRNYYRSLAAVEGISFASLDENPFQLMAQASETVTVTGTAAVEAAARSLPAAHLGVPWYRGCPGIRDIGHGERRDRWHSDLISPAHPAALADFLMERVGRYPIGTLALPNQEYFEANTFYKATVDEAELIAAMIRQAFALRPPPALAE